MKVELLIGDTILPSCRLGASTQLDDIMNTVDRLQQYRLDDQRTALPSSSQSNNHHLNATGKPARLSPLNEQFFEQIAKCQVGSPTLALFRHSLGPLGIPFG